MSTSHYEVLGAEPGATTQQLKASYRRRLKSVHPDSGGSDEAFETLQTAWSVLGDPVRRREYDAWLEDVRPVMGGTRLAVQQRFEERELALERAAWEARRAEVRRRAEARAEAERVEQDARRSRIAETVALRRHLSLGVGALVVLVSVLELTGTGGVPGGGFEVPGLDMALPPRDRAALLVQLVLGVLLALGAVMASPPTREVTGSGRVRFTHSPVFRIALGVLAVILAVVVLGPFLASLV